MSSSTAGTSAMWVGIGLGVLITISVSYLAVWYYRRRSAVIAMQEYEEQVTVCRSFDVCACFFRRLCICMCNKNFQVVLGALDLSA